MSTAAQTLANQQNAQRSTGPQTPEGKAASSRNASTHGLSNAAFTLLPTEDVAGFNAALECYFERFHPQDHHECFLTQLMVQSTWKLARIHRIQAALFKHVLEPDVPAATLEAAMAAAMFKANPNAFQTLERLAHAAERSYFKAIRELERDRESTLSVVPPAIQIPVVTPPKSAVPNEANSAPRTASVPRFHAAGNLACAGEGWALGLQGILLNFSV